MSGTIGYEILELRTLSPYSHWAFIPHVSNTSVSSTMFQATVTISSSGGGEHIHTADFRVESFGEVLRRRRCLVAQERYFVANYFLFNGGRYGASFKASFAAAYPGNVHVNLRKAFCDHDPVARPGL